MDIRRGVKRHSSSSGPCSAQPLARPLRAARRARRGQSEGSATSPRWEPGCPRDLFPEVPGEGSGWGWPAGVVRSVGSWISLRLHLLALTSACRRWWRSAPCFSPLLPLLTFCVGNVFHHKVPFPSEARVGFGELRASCQRTCLSGKSLVVTSFADLVSGKHGSWSEPPHGSELRRAFAFSF